MSILIGNHSVSAIVYGYACTSDGLIVWLELAPQHPKIVGAIRAELSGNARRYLQLRDELNHRTKMVYGLGRGYLTLSVDAAQLAVGPRARAIALRMIAPEAVSPEDVHALFYALEWPDVDAGMALASALEQYSPYPVQIGWGDYLLRTAVEEHEAQPLLCGGVAPSGFALQPGTPWSELIGAGLRSGEITLNGEIVRQPERLPVLAV